MELRRTMPARLMRRPARVAWKRRWMPTLPGVLVALGLVGGLVTGSVGGEEPAAVAAAYRAVLARNVQHARDWLAQKDAKSLAQCAANLQLLTDLYTHLGDDPAWRAASADLRAAVGDLAAAAGAGDGARCAAALERIEAALAASRSVPQGMRTRPANPPALRRLMLVMDAVLADAKVAALTGQVASAKSQAVVLSELGRLVSNARQDQAFATHSRAFVEAAEAVARVADGDLAAARQLVRGVSQRCDACHEGLRD